MKFSKKETVETPLEVLIAKHIIEMSLMEADSDKYKTAAQSLKTLLEARGVEKTNLVGSWKPSADTALIAGTNLIGILAVLHFEKLGVVTSKAFSTILKPKI